MKLQDKYVAIFMRMGTKTNRQDDVRYVFLFSKCLLDRDAAGAGANIHKVAAAAKLAAGFLLA
jgi:hypothetical protein